MPLTPRRGDQMFSSMSHTSSIAPGQTEAAEEAWELVKAAGGGCTDLPRTYLL